MIFAKQKITKRKKLNRTTSNSYSEKTKHLKMAAWISLVSSLAIFALKATAYEMTHSSAILSDALESIVNILAATVALFIINMTVEPADDEHPYGHGKLEFFSSAFEGGLIVFASLVIAVESLRTLFLGEPLHQLEQGLIVVVLAGLFNLILGIYLRKIGRKNNSEALQASSAHVLSDFWTTAGLVVGLFIVKLTNLNWLDPVIAFCIGIQLFFSGYKIVRKSIAGLIDEQDPDSLSALIKAFEKNRSPGMIDLHELRMIRSGSFHHVDAHLVVPEYWPLIDVHDAADTFGVSIVKDYPFDGEVVFHFDPCRQAYCSVCEVEQCPIRKSPFKALRTPSFETAIQGPKPPDENY